MAGKICPNCGAETPSDNRFCGSCGTKIDSPVPGVAAKTMFFGASQPPGRAKLTVIKGEGMDGVTYLLNATEHLAGRTEGAIMALPASGGAGAGRGLPAVSGDQAAS